MSKRASERAPARVRVVAMATMALMAWPTVAHAAATPEELARAEGKATEAKVFFQSGLYAQAAARFMEAFAISKRPALMYNAARAYEEANMAAEATALFQQYMGLPDATAEGRKEALDRIGKQRQRLEVQKTGGGASHAGPSEPDAASSAPAQPTDTAAPTGQQAAGTPAGTAAMDPAPAPNATTATGPTTAPTAGPTTGAGIAAKGQPDALEPREAWVTWALAGSAAVLAASGLLGYLDGIKRMNEANAMDFSVANANNVYNNAADLAERSRNNGAFAGLVAVGLGGWAAWRWLTPDPALRDRGSQRSSSLFGAPALQLGADGRLSAGLSLGGHF